MQVTIGVSMYCNCKDISSFWDEPSTRVFPLLQEIYKGARKIEIPMIEIIRNQSVLHGYGDSNDPDQVRGKDVYFVHVAICKCKDRPLIRITERCLLLSDEELSGVIAQAVDKLKNGESGEFIFTESDHKLTPNP